MIFKPRDENEEEQRELEDIEPPAEPPGTPEVVRFTHQVEHFLDRYRHIAWSLVAVIALALYLSTLPVDLRSALFQALLAERALAGMLVLFSLLALSLLWTTGQRIDAWAFHMINLRGARPPWLDSAMLWLTQFGTSGFALLLAVGLFLFGFRLLAYEVAFGIITLWLLVEVIKALFRRARPFTDFAHARIVGYRAGGRSFPSGHTSQAFFLAAMLTRFFHLDMGGAFLLYALAVLVAITRMYVGAHYPRDVLGGVVVGTVWGALGMIIHPYVQGANW